MKSLEKNNLPVQLTSFIGRSAQIHEVRNLLNDNRLVNLTGAGGAGKTRLAVEIASRSGADFPGGVHYVDLAPVTRPDVVPVAVARAIGLPDQPGRSTMRRVTSSPTARDGYAQTSLLQKTIRRRSRRSASASTGCRWPSNWQRRACGRCRWTTSSAACTTAFDC